MRYVLMVALLAFHGMGYAQADVGLVNLVAGEVAYIPQVGQPGKVKAFMKVREGDRFELPAGAQLRLVYFDGARQELWQGPSGLRASRTQGSPLSGSPAQVATLPASVPQRLGKVPELMQNAKLGGIQVRSAQSRRAPDEALSEARTTYDLLRKDLPGDDITPELYLYSALNEYQLYQDMLPVVDEMLRKQPGNDEVKALGTWVKGRLGR